MPPSASAARAAGSLPAEKRRERLGLLVGPALAALVVDQATKEWALDRLSGGRDIELVGSLRLRLTFNTGAAFGLGDGIAAWLAPVALIVVLWAMWSHRVGVTPLERVATGLIIGGAVGNLADRLLRAGDGFLGGAVVDFIDLGWWPVFNVADMAIVGGGILLVLVSRQTSPSP